MTRSRQSSEGARKTIRGPDLVAAISGRGEMRTYKIARMIRTARTVLDRDSTKSTIRCLTCPVMRVCSIGTT